MMLRMCRLVFVSSCFHFYIHVYVFMFVSSCFHSEKTIAFFHVLQRNVTAANQSPPPYVRLP